MQSAYRSSKPLLRSPGIFEFSKQSIEPADSGGLQHLLSPIASENRVDSVVVHHPATESISTIYVQLAQDDAHAARTLGAAFLFDSLFLFGGLVVLLFGQSTNTCSEDVQSILRATYSFFIFFLGFGAASSQTLELVWSSSDPFLYQRWLRFCMSLLITDRHPQSNAASVHQKERYKPLWMQCRADRTKQNRLTCQPGKAANETFVKPVVCFILFAGLGRFDQPFSYTRPCGCSAKKAWRL